MKVFIETLGCPKNFNDSQVMKQNLIDNGYELSSLPEEADIIVINTCGFINDAKKESIDTIFDYAVYGKRLVVSGCLSERYSHDLAEEMPEVDLFLGVNEYDRISEIFDEHFAKGAGSESREVVSHCYPKVLSKLPRKLEDNPYSCTIKIAEGCNNRCAYCVIPDIRGGYRSKKFEDIISEAKELADAGCKELILIAQDPTNYGKDLYGKFRFAELVHEVCKIDGIHWVRLMYCYEDKITDELIEAMATEPKVCHYIDIPIQHASDNVLKGMYRHSTKESIINTISKLRAKVPDISIRTTLIVGFPGETDEDYEELLDFVNEQEFERLGVFAYSQEEGTPAGDRPDQIDEDVKEERLDQIMRYQLEISFEHNQKMVGNTYEVLVEGLDEDGTSYIGRTQYDAPEIDNSVIFTSGRDLKPGDFVNVKIVDAFDYDLVGVEI